MAFVIGNWKMNLNVADSSLLVERLAQHIQHSRHDVVLCPSFVALHSVHKMLQDRGLNGLFSLGAQNMYFMDEGAFTGEVSPLMLKDLVEFVILGHSERRQHFGEGDELIAKKLAAALRHDLRPILCVGETLAEHEAGEAQRTVQDQLATDLADITTDDASELLIAYEPIWAIGTGNFARPEDAESMFVHIRHFLTERYGSETANRIALLYGGSVDDQNAAAFMAIADCGGLLVGGASLNYEKFATIANA